MVFLIESINSIGNNFVDFSLAMLIQSSLLIAIVFVIDLLIKRKVRAVVRHCIWMLVLVKLVISPGLWSPMSVGELVGDKLEFSKKEVKQPVVEGSLMTEVQKGFESQEVFSHEVAADPALSKSMDASGSSAKSSEWPREFIEKKADLKVAGDLQQGKEKAGDVPSLTWQGGVFTGWCFVVLTLLLLLIQRVNFVKGLIKQSRKTNGIIEDNLEFCKKKLGVKEKVKVRISPNATSPAVCGLFRPVILLPENIGQGFGANELRTILLHELVHVKRKDLWINLVQTLLQIGYFYNPLLWFANSMIRNSREQAVDEAVQVSLGKKAESYPETLLNVAKRAFSRPALSLRMIGVVENKSQLKERIRKMVNKPVPKSAKVGVIGFLVVLIMGVVLLPMAAGKSSGEMEKSKVDFPEKYIGNWKGKAKIIVNWTKQRRLPMEFKVKEDGSVFGHIGDAGLMGRIKENSGWFSDDDEKKYLIKGKLSGDIIEDEGIIRDEIYLILRGVSDRDIIKGGFHTSGWHVGGKNTMKMSGTKMVLQRVSSEEPEVSGNKAQLSNGVTVEILGIGDGIGKGSRWWKADGQKLDDVMVDETNVFVTPSKGKKLNYAVISISSDKFDDINSRFGVEGTNNRGAGEAKKDGRSIKNCRSVVFDSEEDDNVADIRVGIAAGEWETVARREADFDGVHSSEKVTWFGPVENNGYTVLYISHKFLKKDVRVVAIGKNGKEYVGSGSSAWSGGAQSMQKRFRVKLSKIEKFKLQVRDYEWVTFENVSLRQGYETDVEVVRNSGKNFLKDKAKEYVKEFFRNNYRDITDRRTIEWGQPVKHENGNFSIRYKYEAEIWNKDKQIHNKVFTFTENGRFVSVKDADSEKEVKRINVLKDGKEVYLPALDKKEKAKLYDLDTGNWESREGFGDNDRKTHAWVREHGLDLAGVYESGHFGLLAFDVAILQVEKSDLTDEEIIGNEMLAQQEPEIITPLMALKNSQTPAAYIFRTREGSHGLLQILKMTGEPKEIKVRFKLVKESGVEGDVDVTRDNIKKYEDRLDDEVSVGIEKSPHGSGLTVQYAVMEVCRLAGVPYDWDMSAKLADPERRKFIKPLRVKDKKGREIIESILEPVRLGYEIGEKGLYLVREGQVSLNEEQRLYEKWTNEKFENFIDCSDYISMSAGTLAELEEKWINDLSGKKDTEYYRAINCLGEMVSEKAVEALSEIAFEKVEKDNRDRWMAIRALGMIGVKSVVPKMIHLLYHYNLNTRLWAQISLVRLTGVNFGRDWQEWAKWYNKNHQGDPVFLEKISWTSREEWSDPKRQFDINEVKN